MPFDQRLAKLERQDTVAKLSNSAGDPTAILQALEEMEQNVKDECNRLYAPLDKFDELRAKVADEEESLIAVFKRVNALESENEKTANSLHEVSDSVEANRKAIAWDNKQIEKLKQKIEDLEAMGLQSVVTDSLEAIPMPNSGDNK